MGPYAPAHYLKQFHPKYVGADKATEMAKAGWHGRLDRPAQVQEQLRAQPGVPGPDAVEDGHAESTRRSGSLERNPYFWQVDTEGNQLPYIDKIQLPLGENLEVVNLRAIAGEYDEMGRHMDMPKLPVFLENQQKGGYKVVLDLEVRVGAGRHPHQPELRGRRRRSASG